MNFLEEMSRGPGVTTSRVLVKCDNLSTVSGIHLYVKFIERHIHHGCANCHGGVWLPAFIEITGLPSKQTS